MIDTDILVIGGGFAGVSLFRNLNPPHRKVTLLTNRNHFLFSPLLPLAATGVVEVRSIVEPLRSFQRFQHEILIGQAIDLDPDKNKVIADFPESVQRDIFYRTLILAMGSTTSTHGIPGVKEHCYFFKEMKDARTLREKILLQFDRAAELDRPAREAALRFVIVGAGPTGVELACEIQDLIHEDLEHPFKHLIDSVEVLLIESHHVILRVFDKALAEYAKRKLHQKKIHLRTGVQVKAIEKDRVILNSGEIIPCETIIWTAGVTAQAFTKRASERLGVKLDNYGRLPVKQTMAVECSHPNVFAIGDCASARNHDGQPLPATAQVAMKEGIFLARQLSRGTVRNFQYHSMGMLASLGTDAAIADLPFLKLKGVVAMWFWKAAYLTRLVSWRNKLTVAFDFIKLRLFGRNTARIDF